MGIYCLLIYCSWEDLDDNFEDYNTSAMVLHRDTQHFHKINCILSAFHTVISLVILQIFRRFINFKKLRRLESESQ